MIEIDFIQYPLFNFDDRTDKKDTNIHIKTSKYSWNVAYEPNTLNSFDYRIFMYLLSLLYPFESNELVIEFNHIIKDLKLDNSEKTYDRIKESLDKFNKTTITAEACRADKTKRCNITHQFHIIPDFFKLENTSQIIYKITFDELLINNMQNRYYLYHEHEFRYIPTNHLYFYLLHRKKNNNFILVSYNKLCILFQFKEHFQKSRIESQMIKYFEDIVKNSGLIEKYELYRTDQWIFKTYYNKFYNPKRRTDAINRVSTTENKIEYIDPIPW